MKTAREVLFRRHDATDAKLDALRREVVVQLSPTPIAHRESLAPNFALTLWQELVLPARRIWAGLGAMWLLMLVVNVSLRDPGEASPLISSPSSGMMTTWQQQERLLAELSEPRREHVATSPPKPIAPQPRSDRRDAARRPIYA